MMGPWMNRTTNIVCGTGLAALLVVAPAALACGYHDPTSASLGMLNWAYPESLHVRTAVWMARRDGALSAVESSDAIASTSPEHILRRMELFRQTERDLRQLQQGIATALDGEAVPSFSVVLIGSMLWTRFQYVDGALAMAVHVEGPASEDVVLVTDAPVIASLASGALVPEEARRRGLLRTYGTARSVERVDAAFDRLASQQAAGKARR